MILVVPPRSRTKLWVYVGLLLIIAVVGGVSYLAWRQSTPGVSASLEAPFLPAGELLVGRASRG